MNRRIFCSGIAAGFAARPSVARAALLASEGFRNLREDLAAISTEEAYWNRVRREFCVSPGLVHLNTGTLGSTPRRVLDAVSALMYELEGDPAGNVFGPLGSRMESVRAKAAEFLGAELDEVALTENTTAGMNAVAQGVARWLREGDEILSTDHEHPGGSVCWEYLERQLGVKVVRIPMPAPVRDPDQVLQLVCERLTPRTRIVSLSHVETITGLRMPLAEIAAVTRPRQILLVCDGAQAPGMLKVDVKALGVDTYASSSHKWMLAPKGSGLLYVRREVQDRVQPMVLSAGYQSYTAASGTRNVPQILGHGLAMDFHHAIGRDRVEKRCCALAAELRGRLERIGALKLLSPTHDQLASGIVTFGLRTGKNQAIYERLLAEHNIVVKVVPKPEYNALRFSTHVYNCEDDLDRTAALLERFLGS